MFHNYFFLKRLADALKSKLAGLELITCFSQNKDELILGFGSKDQEFWIRANLSPQVSLLSFPPSFARSRRNSVDLFDSLVGSTVKTCKVFSYERSFELVFENGQRLIFKMHGSRSNVLYSSKGKIREIFRNKLTPDLSLNIQSLDKTIEVTQENFAENNYHPNSLIPALGKEIDSYWNENYTHLQDKEKWAAFQKLLNDLETNPIFVSDTPSPHLTLIPSQDSFSTNDPVAASNTLYEKLTYHLFTGKEKQSLINQLKSQIKKSESYLFKTSEKLRSLNDSRNPEEIANLIMANLNLIQNGLSKVTLHDFYSNGFIEVKLNPKLSPQKNAENYYRKSKNRHKEIDTLNQNIDAKEDLIKKIKRQLEELESIENSKELKAFAKKYNLRKDNKREPENHPYHEHELEGWKILIGKNAKANDELTLKIANKNDLWLHAKDVSGSHVVVRQQPGRNYPKHVIEHAAGLAAYHSKRKTDSLCPVIFTQKKYVRKVKGSPPGQVIVEKEEVVMIEPISS